MKHPERIKFIIWLALVTLFASVFLLSQVAYAKTPVNVSYIENDISLNGLFDKNDTIKKTKLLVLDKTNKLTKEQKEAQEIVNAKKSLENEVLSLRESVDNLSDMFVHIDKYAHDAAGNTYVPGNCTYGVKSWRPDISNSWGNANTWYSEAQSDGWNVGSKPKKGAVATSTDGWLGHVAYVESVSVDGQFVTIKEMNYGYLWNLNTRTVHYTEFRYIYELN